MNWLSTPIKNAESLDHEPMDCEDGNEVIRTSTSLYRVVPYTDEEITFADSFVKWFYPLLNATFNSEESSKEFGSQHFWIDASAKICLEEIEFCGHIISGGRRRPAPGKLLAIQQVSVPITITDLRGFLGLTNYTILNTMRNILQP